MQECWNTQDTLMTFKLLKTLLWEIRTAFMVMASIPFKATPSSPFQEEP